MAARRRDLERPLRVRLPAHVPEVDVVGRGDGEQMRGIRPGARDRTGLVEERGRLGE